MRYASAVAFRRALEDRLKVLAIADPTRLARDHKRIAYDRMLARLVATAPGDWVLKGGFAMDLRLRDRARTTKDVDLAWHAEDDALTDALLDAAATDLGDHFVISLERTDAQPDLGGSHRFHVAVSLAGRPFESFLLDVGTYDDPVAGYETLTTPDLLGFAGVAPVTVPALPLATQVAEKLHAYTRTYEGGRPRTRTKDLIDLALVAALFPLDAHELRTAIDTVFARRATHQPPDALPTPPPTWRTATANSPRPSNSATTSTQATQLPPRCSTPSYNTTSRPRRGIRATKSGTEAFPPFNRPVRMGSEPSPERVTPGRRSRPILAITYKAVSGVREQSRVDYIFSDAAENSGRTSEVDGHKRPLSAAFYKVRSLPGCVNPDKGPARRPDDCLHAGMPNAERIWSAC